MFAYSSQSTRHNHMLRCVRPILNRVLPCLNPRKKLIKSVSRINDEPSLPSPLYKLAPAQKEGIPWVSELMEEEARYFKGSRLHQHVTWMCYFFRQEYSRERYLADAAEIAALRESMEAQFPPTNEWTQDQIDYFETYCIGFPYVTQPEVLYEEVNENKSVFQLRRAVPKHDLEEVATKPEETAPASSKSPAVEMQDITAKSNVEKEEDMPEVRKECQALMFIPSLKQQIVLSAALIDYAEKTFWNYNMNRLISESLLWIEKPKIHEVSIELRGPVEEENEKPKIHEVSIELDEPLDEEEEEKKDEGGKVVACPACKCQALILWENMFEFLL